MSYMYYIEPENWGLIIWDQVSRLRCRQVAVTKGGNTAPSMKRPVRAMLVHILHFVGIYKFQKEEDMA